MKKILACFLSVLMVLTCIIIPGMVVSAATPEYLDHYNFSVKEGEIFNYAVGAYSTGAGKVTFSTGDSRADRTLYPFYTANAIKNGSTSDTIGYEELTVGEETYDSIGIKFKNPTCLVPMMADGKPFELAPGKTYTVDISYAVTANDRTKNDSYFAAAGGVLLPYFTNAEYISDTVPEWDDVKLGRVFSSATTVIPVNASVTGELKTTTLTFTTKAAPAEGDTSYSYNAEENTYTVTSSTESSVELSNYFQIYLLSYGTVEINFTHIEITSEDYVPQTTVEYIVDGEVVKTETVDQGTDYAITYIHPHTATKRFAGWYYDEALTNKVKHNTASISTNGIDTLRLYAKMVEYETNITMPVNNVSWGTGYYPYIADSGAYIVNMSTKRNSSSGYIFVDAEKLSFKSDSSNRLFLLVARNPENGDLLVAKPGAEYKVTLKYKVINVPESGKYYMQAGYDLLKDSTLGGSSAFAYHSSEGQVTDNNVSDETKELSQNIVIGERSGGYPFLGFRIIASKGVEVEIYELKVEEVISEDLSTGEFLVTENADNRTTYKVEFDYKLNETLNEDVGIGFKTTDASGNAATYVEAENTAIYTISADKAVDEWNHATAFVTTDMLAVVTPYAGTDDTLTALNSMLYAYIIGAENYSKISVKDITAKNLDDVVGKGTVYILTEKAAATTKNQALRFSFGYVSTTGSNITIDGVTYTVKNRGFIYLNGQAYALDNRYAGNINLTTAKAEDSVFHSEKSTGLENCWEYDNGTGTLYYSTYIKGFAPDDEKELMIRGYVTVECDGQTFTLYSDTFNRSVDYMTQ